MPTLDSDQFQALVDYVEASELRAASRAAINKAAGIGWLDANGDLIAKRERLFELLTTDNDLT